VSETHRVRIGISPHAPYTCSLDTYRFCRSLGVPVGTHLAESANEVEWLLAGRGPLQGIAPLLVRPTGERPVASLEPVLGPELLCAHCVEVEGAEVALLAERGVPVAHCPRSNALLGCGIAPVALLRDAGVVVGLGTDSPASSPSFDVFEEMRAAVYAARARERRADALTAEDALGLATADAARALRMDAEVGTLTPGKRADLAVVSLDGSPYHPVEDPAASVVFGGSPDRVLETIVDGQTRYRKAEEEKWREVRSIASAARARMLGSPPRPR
jgi:5-methylthioadenosine/S-adenosylhomocysteine deaminase